MFGWKCLRITPAVSVLCIGGLYDKSKAKKAPLPSFSACDSAKGQIGLIWYIIHARDAQYICLKKSCSWNTYKRGNDCIGKDRKPPDRHHLGAKKIRPQFAWGRSWIPTTYRNKSWVRASASGSVCARVHINASTFYKY